MKTVVVIDYGMSNLRSVSKAIEHVAAHHWRVKVTNEPNEVLIADKVVFPGQGAIGNCMRLLQQSGLADAIQEVLTTKPFLGICLGLQTLLTHSEESGGTAGFGVIEGVTRRFQNSGSEHLKIPHMGWNQVQQIKVHPLWCDIPDCSRFYFVHSYHVVPSDTDVVAATTPYGIEFVSAVAKDNVFAVQFHPEKSQQMGLILLRNFLQI